MTLEEKITRINELYHLSQERPLNEEELAEQKALRTDYLNAIRASVKGQLSQIEIEEQDGSRHGLVSINDKKKELRTLCRDIRKNISEERRLEAEDNLIREFVRLAKILRCEKVLLYSSLPDEVSTDKLFETLRKEGITCYFPQVTMEGLKFYSIKMLEELLPGRYSVREPIGSIDVRIDPNEVPNGESLLILVPGLAFDGEGYRIGYGKGYYDAYLSEHAQGVNIKSVGVCMKECKAEDIEGWDGGIPVNRNDVKTDVVLFV